MHNLRALALAGLALFVTGAVQAQTPKRGGTAVFTLSQDPGTINPVVSSNVPDRQLGCIVYEGLVEVTDDFKIVPLLAKSWTISPDGLTYSFDLAPAKWHDGKPFTSEDVKYSLLDFNTKYSPIFGAAGRSIASIDTPAPDKVVIKLKQPFGPFLISLSCITGGAIMPAHLYRGTDPMTNPTTTSTPVGTGPFRLAEWKHGDLARLERVPDYYANPGHPYLDVLVAKVITDARARIQALQAGEVDLVQFPDPSGVATITRDPKLKVETSDVAPLSDLGFYNTTRKPLDDKRVRQALFMALNREYFMRAAFFGVGKVGTQPFTRAIPWTSSPSVDYEKMYPFDPVKANALLDEAGVKRGADGKRFALHVAILGSQYPELRQVAQAMRSMWQAVGVDVTIDALEDATFLKQVYTDANFDVALTVYTSYSDPALGITRTFATSAIGRPYGNASHYSNPKVDALFEKAQQATDTQERGKYYIEAESILADDLPVLQLRDYQGLDFASKSLMGIWGTVQGNGHWSDGWLDR